MKNRIINLTLLLLSAIVYASCGSTKPVAETRSTNPFNGEFYSAPDAEIDTKEYFVGTGFAYGTRIQKSSLQQTALTGAQDIVRQKMSHSYKGMISNYMNNYGNDVGTDIQTKLERGGIQIIDKIIGDTYESATAKFSAVDEKGQIECVVNIRIYKNELADKIAKKAAEDLSSDEKLQIDFKEDQFRQKMQEAFSQYKGGK